MAQTLNYIVENSQIVTLQKEIEFEGQKAVVSYDRAIIEALPAEGIGQTFAMTIPVKALADFPEGSSITVTVEATPVEAAPAA